jgi:hypothetical protein
MNLNPAAVDRQPAAAGIGAAGSVSFTAASGQVVSVHFIKTTATACGPSYPGGAAGKPLRGVFVSSLLSGADHGDPRR